jgi:hypothetical protein
MLDLIIAVVGVAYGIALVAAAFVRNRFTEAIRIDALMLPNPTDATRMLNLVIGGLLIAYEGYSLLK